MTSPYRFVFIPMFKSVAEIVIELSLASKSKQDKIGNCGFVETILMRVFKIDSKFDLVTLICIYVFGLKILYIINRSNSNRTVDNVYNINVLNLVEAKK